MPNFTRYISKDFPIEGSFLRLDDREKAWEQIDGRMRTAVRKAQKSGAVIREVKGTKKEMDAFREFCLNPDDIPPVITDRHHLYVAELQGELVAGILLVEIGDKLFMLCHASTPVAKEAEIPSLLIWQMVEEWSGKRFRQIDIGASYRSTLQKFFSGWATKRYPVILKPPELAPNLRLTPFDTQAMDTPVLPDASKIVASALEAKWNGKPHTFFPRAMYAISTLIKWLRSETILRESMEVWITTTTDTHYVSSCITSAIEQSIPWSRTLGKKTGAIFLVHEFGFPHPKLQELRKIADERGIPLIEDCAYGWNTKGIGSGGDYAIYSLTKAFPVQFGGYLVGKSFTQQELWNDYGCNDEGKRAYTETQLAPWIAAGEKATAKRREHYQWFMDLFGGARTYFQLPDGVEPGAYILKMESEARMEEVSAFVRRFGIECGNYWRNSAIILPVHQRLAASHLAYIAGSVLATERQWCGVPNPPHGAHRQRH